MNTITVKEYNDLPQEELEPFADELEKYCDSKVKILAFHNRWFRTQNYVGVIRLNEDTQLEIVPKLDLGSDEKHSKELFYNMLRHWGGEYKSTESTRIQKLKDFTMLEIFISLFLNNLLKLITYGLASRYVQIEDNLPYLKGRLNFPEHILENIANKARFSVSYDEFSANIPSNRLINKVLHKLTPDIKNTDNKHKLQRSKAAFCDIPPSLNVADDWERHRVDRTMPHYKGVMWWVRLFLYHYGLTVFSGDYYAPSLLVPMEEVFEQFVANCFESHQKEFSVIKQGPRKWLAESVSGGSNLLKMKPDIYLESRNGDSNYVLDTKWKRIGAETEQGERIEIDPGDAYQVFAYGKSYGCSSVALIYPKHKGFLERRIYEMRNNLTLYCFPFDVGNPKDSVDEIVKALKS